MPGLLLRPELRLPPNASWRSVPPSRTSRASELSSRFDQLRKAPALTAPGRRSLTSPEQPSDRSLAFPRTPPEDRDARPHYRSDPLRKLPATQPQATHARFAK